jgi:hypothetical protein
MSKKEFIDDLQNENSTFSSQRQAEMVANLLDTVSSDIYSESQRFVFELIQNADDAAKDTDNEVHFDFLPNCLIVSHNGKSFDENDIISLTGAGASTKRADPTKTGYKGIGFKSVFGKSERVTIFSDGYQFRFDKAEHKIKLPWQIIPLWSEPKDLSIEVQASIAKRTFAVSTILEIKKAELLQNDLNDLLKNGQILLFLRRVSKISVSKNGEGVYCIEKKVTNKQAVFNEVTLLKDGKEISSWITKTFDSIPVPEKTKMELRQDEKTPEKLRESEITEISFAAKIDGQKIKPLKKDESLIFTYLPTKVSDFEFPFLVNGSFITNAAREGLHQDRIWNQWLFELIAEKILDWLVSLSASKFKFQLLHLLPHKFNNAQNELKKCFDGSFSGHCPNKAFIITEGESIKKPSEVVLDKTGLSIQEFIDPKSIIEFLKTEKKLTYSDDCFLNSKVEESNKLKSIGVETFELENFETFFISKSFTNRHQVSENFNLIKYFNDKSDNDKQGIWFQTLKTLPFIFNEKELLFNPSNGICFPTGVNSTELGDIPIIHPDVFDKIQKDKPVYAWLKTLGVKEPSQVAFVTNVIIPNLKKTDFINDSNFLQITHYLFRLFKENLLDEEMLESLRELKLKTKKPDLTFKEAQYCFLSNKYQPQLKIEGLINEVPYVSEEYLFSGSSELEWNLFFRAIKVKDRVEIEVINKNNSLPTLRNLTAQGWVDKCAQKAGETPGAFGFGDHNIISDLRIPSFLNTVSLNYDYSKLFWENLINGNSISEVISTAKFYYGVGYGTNSYSVRVENYFPWFIKNKNCIPTTTEQILKPENVFVNDKEIKQIAGNYLPVFEYEEPLPDDWKEFLQLKSKLELSDYLSILTKIAEQIEKDDSKIKIPLRRIGLIYNKLSALLPDMTEINKQFISKWALQNKLLCANGKFEPANDLKWITVEGFSTESEKLKIIQLPENSNKSLETFKELISLLQVQSIDKFIPTFDSPFPDNSIKNKLELILPYYVALIEKKKIEDSHQEFERLYSILNTTTFFTANEIKLSFNYQSETFDGPSLTVFKEENKFYFKGKWRSERTLLSLIKELSILLGVVGLNEELRFLLLESEKNEIQEWLLEQGINLSGIKPVRAFSKRVIALYDYEPGETPVEEIGVEEGDEIYGSEGEIAIYESFEPVTTPNGFDVTKISARTKVFTDATVKAEENYSKIQSQEVREDVGRWCEEFVYEYMTKQNNNFTEVIWENKEGESGKPYDFKVKENGKEKFIDVKGTPSGIKDLIYLSPNEWVFMFDKGVDYSIYRVYSAGNDARIEIIENPSGLLQQGKIFPNPITLQV